MERHESNANCNGRELEPSVSTILGQFSRAWEADQKPDIVAFISGVGAARTNLLTHLVRLDIHYRRQRGDEPKVGDYVGLFPTEEAAIRECFMAATVYSSPLNQDGLDVTSAHVSGESMPSALPRWSAPRYQVLTTHAKGGLGEVFLAHDLELHREVALKEIQAWAANDPNVRADLFREGLITGRLEHPSIAPVYSLGEFENGRPFYVMRFIRGESLKDAINCLHRKRGVVGRRNSVTQSGSGQVSQSEAHQPKTDLRHLLSRYVQVCNAVAFAHSRGIIHRDIKPGNIMLGPFGETLLVDWGLAKILSAPDGERAGLTSLPPLVSKEGTQHGQVKGTPAYMSPEQARGETLQLGPATDIYSLGATLYTILTGHTSVEGKSTEEVLTKVTSGQIIPLRARVTDWQVPKPLEAICMKAMALDPKDRYPNAVSLANDVENYLADEPVQAYPEPAVVRGRRWLRKHPAFTACGILLTVVTLFGSLGIAARERSHSVAISKKQREAEDNFQSAKVAWDNYIETVKSEELLKQPLFKPLLKDLLKDANDFYRDFVVRSGEQPERQYDLALSLLNVGWLSDQSGDPEVAKGAYERAIVVYKTLVSHDPDAAAAQQHLAIYHSNLGLLYNDTSNVQLAKDNYLQAIKVADSLVQRYPSIAGYQDLLAAGLSNLGALQRAASDYDGASSSYKRAIGICEKLAQRYPSEGLYHNRLATSHGGLGIVLWDMSDFDGAYTQYTKAIEICERLSLQHPATFRYSVDLVMSLTNLGVLLRDAAKLDEARQCFERAIEIGERSVAEHPTVSECKAVLGRSYRQLGVLQRDVPDVDAAQHNLARAIALSEELASQHQTVTEYQNDLSDCYNHRGLLLRYTGETAGAERDFKRVIEIGERLVEQNPHVLDFQRDLAAGYLNFGTMRLDHGDLVAARQYFTRAVQIEEALVAQSAISPAFKSDLAAALANLANIKTSMSDMVGAQADYERAVQITEQLVSQNSTVMEYQDRLATIHVNLGVLLLETNDANGARGSLNRSIALFELLLESGSNKVDIASKLAVAINNLAEVETRQLNLTLARDLLRRAEPFHRQVLAANPLNSNYRDYFVKNRRSLITACVSSKQHGEAVAAARDLAEFANDHAGIVNAVASICICITMAREDDTLGAREKEAVIKGYGDEAMQVLAALVERGFRDTSAFQGQEFLPLTVRKEFRDLLATMSTAAPEGDTPPSQP